MDRTPHVIAQPSVHDALPSASDHPLLAARFAPIFQRIADTALERERQRILPTEPITWLKQAGFGAVRVPLEHGGGGASIPQLFQLLIRLSEADSNVTQALRGHFAFVKDRLNAPASPEREVWFQRFVAGELVLRAGTDLFNALGASAASTSKALDRHWRNARVVASHNPIVYKSRIVGDWRINGTEPPYVWQIGNGPDRKV